MKVKNVIMLVAALLMHASVGHALDYNWGENVKNTVADVTALGIDDNADEHQVYFYNEKTGMFLNVGRLWGTELVSNTIGLPFKIIQSDTDNKYYIYTSEVQTEHGSYVSYYINSLGTGSSLFADRGTGDGQPLFEFVNAGIPDKNYYYIKGKFNNTNSFNITVGEDLNKYEKELLFTSDESEYSRWLLVTLKDFKNRLKAQYIEAKYTDPADATFHIQDQAIQRTYDDVTRRYWLTQSANGSSCNLYTGNDDNYGKSQNALADYGKYWHAYTTGFNNGEIYQALKVTHPGWYRLTCEGFYYAESSSNMNAYLFANGYQTTLNNIDETSYSNLKNNYVKTGDKLIINEGRTLYEGKYPNLVMVHIDENDKLSDGTYLLKIGIKIEGNDKSGNRVVFDNFQLKYCCLHAIVLDENLGTENENGDNVHEYGQPLILKRTFTVNKWNSFCLPVDLSRKQVFNAFGNDIKLATLTGVMSSDNEKIIHFNYVDPYKEDDEDAILLEKDKFYLVKPTDEGMTENSGTSKEQHFYVIDDVVLNEKVNVSGSFEDQSIYSTRDNKNFTNGDIVFYGSYINLNNQAEGKYVNAPSYILKDDNVKYGFHYCMKPELIKGFRCWIHETGEWAENSLSKISFSFGNGNVVSSIDQLEEDPINTFNTNNKVYNLAGQQVSKNYKGLVIKNGKKYYNK